MPIIRSVSGLRITINEITPELIKKYAIAFHKFLPSGNIIIGRDGRPSGEWIEKILAHTFISLGRNVNIIGIVPTPTVQVYIEKHCAAGGIAITASHNPSEWNGLKFLNSQGVFLDIKENNLLWSFLDNENTENNNSNNVSQGEISYISNAIDEHIETILDVPFIQNEIENIKKNNFNVAVDAVNASGSVAVIKLLEKLNCNYHKLYCDETGIFPHTPEPLVENLTDLSDYIRLNSKENYIGIAVDPDADRLVLIDESGEYIGEEKTVCIAIDSYFTLNNKFDNELSDKLVTVNQSTTKLADRIAEKYKSSVLRTPVGEINVVKKMKETGSVIGGEGSGGVILPDCHYGRDSLVGVTLTLALLAKRQTTLKQLSDGYPKFEMLKYKQQFVGNKDDLYSKVIEKYSTHNISQIDGIRIELDDSWVHLRTSNTEPIIRIIAEAPTKNQAQNLINSLIAIIE